MSEKDEKSKKERPTPPKPDPRLKTHVELDED